MPILWRYLLIQFTRVLLLCTGALIAILLVMRLGEVARFATMGAGWVESIQFLLYQIPYILPIAIPISALVASLLLMQRLSDLHELTALRASGFSIKEIYTPILLLAALLSLGNFYLISEVSASSHLTAGWLKTQLRTVNPLMLAQSKHAMKLQGFYFNTLGASNPGETASDIILAFPGKARPRLTLIVAKQLYFSAPFFKGEKITLITAPTKDSFLVENIGDASITLQNFSEILRKGAWTINNDHLRLPLLLAKLEQLQQKRDEDPAVTRKEIQRNYSEIIRRISLGITPFSFSLMGLTFGISISRKRSYRNLLWIAGLTILFIACYFAGQAMAHVLPTAASFYLAPHGVILVCSLWVLWRLSKGIES